MKTTGIARRLGAAVLGVLLLAGAVRAAEPEAPPDVTLRRQGHGWIIADPKGMTLYTFAKDPKGGKPACEGKCIENWPPLLAAPDAKPFGPWSLADRGDGQKQWAFAGKPLYRYVRDAAPGDINGDEQLQQWNVALKPLPTPPGFGIFKTPRGQLLVDQKRMTLYVSDADSATKSACEGACTRTWRPVEAWWLAAAAVPDFSIVDRPDGTRQWAFKGKPLYRYAADFNPGEFGGEAEKGWHIVVLEPPPPVPSWVTVQESDGGELYADARGKTIYMQDLSRPRGLTASRPMETPELWEPLLASDADKPVGLFAIVTNAEGQRQWAYRGMLLFTHKRDTQPGDINGVRNMDRVWRTIMTSGQTMAGSGN